jgi:hypothetical protein
MSFAELRKTGGWDCDPHHIGGVGALVWEIKRIKPADLATNGAHNAVPKFLARRTSCHGGVFVVVVNTSHAFGQSPQHCPSPAAVWASVAPAGAKPTQVALTANDTPIWKTITVGGSKGVNAVRQAMDTAPCPIWVGDEADEILGRPAFPFNKRPFELDLVILSVFELGFGDRASRNDPELGASVEASLSDIYARAASLGFELCPVEAGPALRLNYLDQPLGEFLHIAMKPVARYSGELVDFTVGNGGAGLMLVGGNGHPEVKLPGATRFVFVRPHADTVAGGSVRDGGGNLVER